MMNSLRVRLIAAVIATTALVVAVAAGATWLANARARGLDFDQDLRDRLRDLRPGLELVVWRHARDPSLPPETISAGRDPDAPFLVLADPADRVLARSPDGDPAVLPAASAADGVVQDADLPGHGPVRWLAMTLVGRPPPGQGREDRPAERADGRRDAPGHDRPSARLILGRSTRRLQDGLAQQAWLLAGMSLGICLLMAVLTALVVDRLLRPLRRLHDGIAGLEPGAGAILAVPGLPQELRPVQARLNDLMQRVGQVLERERQTTATIAHELRTPLAGLRAKLELALLRERGAAEMTGLCRQALTSLSPLQGLVDNLLMLARLEAGQGGIQREAVEVAEVVAGAWALLQPMAEARGLGLERRIEPALALTTDPAKLRTILGNLLANAVAYADPVAPITLDATEDPDGLRIVLANRGATIAPADAERVFEPFWRGDTARRVEDGHCGLGLPLVRRLAGILGGQVTATVEGDRFTVVLRLPA